MENKNNELPFEIIIKENGEVSTLIKTNCIFAVINEGDSSRKIIMAKCSTLDLILVSLTAQEMINEFKCDHPEVDNATKYIESLKKEQNNEQNNDNR